MSSAGHKLTKREVLEIKYSTGKQVAIAKKYGISQSAVSLIRGGKSYAGVKA